MDIMSRFPSKWLRPDDLPGRQPTVVTIIGVELEKMRGADTIDGKKPVVYFDELGKKGLVIGKVVAGQFIEVIGERDSAKWVGKRVELFVTQTQTPDGIVNCIRARKPSSARPPAPGEKGEFDDDVPF